MTLKDLIERNETRPGRLFDGLIQFLSFLWFRSLLRLCQTSGKMFGIILGGRIFTFAVLMVGLGLLAEPAGLIASAITGTKIEEDSPHDAD